MRSSAPPGATRPNRALVAPISPTSQVVPVAEDRPRLLPGPGHHRAAPGGQRLDKAPAPGIGIVAAQARHHRVPPLLALADRHFEPLHDRLGHPFDIVRIDQDRLAEFVRGAGKARQDRHAGIVGILRGEILLDHEVHAVAQRRHQRRVRAAR